jgi:hypothetical protein
MRVLTELTKPISKPQMTLAQIVVFEFTLPACKAPPTGTSKLPPYDGLFWTILIAKSASNETPEHGSEVVYSNQTTLLRRVGNHAIGTNTYSFYISRYTIHETHNTLIVVFKDKRHGTEEIEHPEQDVAWYGAPRFRSCSCHDLM